MFILGSKCVAAKSLLVIDCGIKISNRKDEVISKSRICCKTVAIYFSWLKWNCSLITWAAVVHQAPVSHLQALVNPVHRPARQRRSLS